MNNDDQSHDMENISIKDIFNEETGELMCSTFPHALKIDVIYRLVKNTTGSSSDVSLEGTVGKNDYVRSYIMPHDKLIIEALRELSSDQARQLIFEYQVVKLPDNNPGYLENNLATGKSRVFKYHPGLDRIFFDICMIETGTQPEVIIKRIS